MTSPVLSVVVPCHDAEDLLSDTLGALAASDLERSRWELIVVDDASSDGSAKLAEEYADRLVHLEPTPRGPAFARNRGADVARGSVLVFLDSDVRIAPDALSRVLRLFEREPDVAAVFGSYDDQPPAPGLVSRYRNLLHHYHHHRGAGEAETFWAGLGAVRSDAFRELGGFDEVRYARPQIEDIELGRRIRRAGHRIVLDPAIQGAHLKRWTLLQVVRTDLLHRGIPWTRLILAEGAADATLNIRPKEKLCVGLVGAGLALLAVAALTRRPVIAIAAAALLAVVVLLNLELYRYLARGRGVRFGIGVVPLHLLYYLISGLSYAAGTIAHRLGRGREPASTPPKSPLQAEQQDA